LCLFFTLNSDGALGDEGSNSTYYNERWEEDGTDHAGSDREGEDNLAFVVFDGYFADVAFFNKCFDFTDNFFTFDFDLLLDFFTDNWFLHFLGNFFLGGHIFSLLRQAQDKLSYLINNLIKSQKLNCIYRYVLLI
jgi:hypothetical protein